MEWLNDIELEVMVEEMEFMKDISDALVDIALESQIDDSCFY